MQQLPVERPIALKRTEPVSPELKLLCMQRVAHCLELYRAQGVAMKMPTISFDLRGKTAGKAHKTRWHVQLNAVLLNENTDAFIERTVGHETAHLATWAHFGTKAAAHGKEWGHMMQVIGQAASRCHSYDTTVSAVSAAAYRYACGCQEFLFTIRRHNTAQTKGYRCRACKRSLKFIPDAV